MLWIRQDRGALAIEQTADEVQDLVDHLVDAWSTAALKPEAPRARSRPKSPDLWLCNDPGTLPRMPEADESARAATS